MTKVCLGLELGPFRLVWPTSRNSLKDALQWVNDGSLTLFIVKVTWVSHRPKRTGIVFTDKFDAFFYSFMNTTNSLATLNEIRIDGFSKDGEREGKYYPVQCVL